MFPATVDAQSEQSDESLLRVESKNCGERLDPVELFDAIRLELRSADPLTLGYLEQSSLTVLLFCMEEHIQVSLRDVSLFPVGRIRADRLGLVRFVALATVESITARAMERASPPEPEVTTPEAQPDVESGKGLWLRLFGGGRLGFEDTWLRGNGGLGLVLAFDNHWALEIDAALERGGFDHTLGNITASGVEGALLLRPGLALSDTVHMAGGFGVRGGAVHWSGEPNAQNETEGLSGWGSWLAAVLGVRFEVLLSPEFGVELGAEGGWLFVDAEASVDGMRAVSLGPAYIGLELGLTWRALKARQP